MESVIAIDWADDWAKKKPFCLTYDGVNVELFNTAEEIGNIIESKGIEVILIETGAPYSVIAQIARDNCKILEILGNETKKFRESKGLEKTDENDTRCVYLLYKEKPELYREKEKRNVIENKLGVAIKKREIIKKEIVRIKLRTLALQKEYFSVNELENAINYFERLKDDYEKDIIEYTDSIYTDEVAALKYEIFGDLTDITARIFAAKIVNVKRFSNFKKFKKYCGWEFLVHKNDKNYDKKQQKFDRELKSVLYQMVQSRVVANKKEPYYIIYNNYIKRKLNEGKTEANAKKLAIRKICQIWLKKIWKALWYASKNREARGEFFEWDIPVQKYVKKSENENVNMKNEKKRKVKEEDKNQQNLSLWF